MDTPSTWIVEHVIGGHRRQAPPETRDSSLECFHGHTSTRDGQDPRDSIPMLVSIPLQTISIPFVGKNRRLEIEHHPSLGGTKETTSRYFENHFDHCLHMCTSTFANTRALINTLLYRVTKCTRRGCTKCWKRFSLQPITLERERAQRTREKPLRASFNRERRFRYRCLLKLEN